MTKMLQNDESKVDGRGVRTGGDRGGEDMRQLMKRAKRTGGLSGFTGGNDPAFW